MRTGTVMEPIPPSDEPVEVGGTARNAYISAHQTGAESDRPRVKSHPVRDVEVREALGKRLRASSRDEDFLVVPEVRVQSHQVRMDVLKVAHRLTAWEIKSDFDTLKRLPTQVSGYNAVADRAVLVVGDRWLEKADNSIPEWWGIWHAHHDGKHVRLKIVRLGKANPRVDVVSLAGFLSRWELTTELQVRGISRLSSLSVESLRLEFVRKLGRRQAMSVIKNRMLYRADWTERAMAGRVSHPFISTV